MCCHSDEKTTEFTVSESREPITADYGRYTHWHAMVESEDFWEFTIIGIFRCSAGQRGKKREVWWLLDKVSGGWGAGGGLTIMPVQSSQSVKYPILPSSVTELLKCHPLNAASRVSPFSDPQRHLSPTGLSVFPQVNWQRTDKHQYRQWWNEPSVTLNALFYLSKLDMGIMYMSPNPLSLVILIALCWSSVAKMIWEWCPFLR